METIATQVSMVPEGAAPNRRSPMFYWQMFVNPVETLASLREIPRVFLPMITAAILATAVHYYVLYKVGLRTLMEAAIRATGSIDVDALVANAMVHRDEIVMTQAISAFLGLIVTVLLLALLYWLLVTVVGGDASYQRIVAVVAHVTLFTTVIKESMIALVLTVSRNPSSFNLKNPLGTNPAFYLRTASPALNRILLSADALTIAGIVLTIIGIRRVSSSLSTNATVAIVVIPWLVYVAAAAWLPWLG
jgi:hypothetical protein